MRPVKLSVTGYPSADAAKVPGTAAVVVVPLVKVESVPHTNVTVNGFPFAVRLPCNIAVC